MCSADTRRRRRWHVVGDVIEQRDIAGSDAQPRPAQGSLPRAREAAAGYVPMTARLAAVGRKSGRSSARWRCQRDQLRRGNPGEICCRASNAGPLRAAEEEQFVLLDRTARRVSELIAGENRFRLTVGIVLEGIRREAGDAVELVCRAVEVVGSPLGYDVYDAARCAAVFRREVTRGDRKLLNRIERHLLADCAANSSLLLAPSSSILVEDSVGR